MKVYLNICPSLSVFHHKVLLKTEKNPKLFQKGFKMFVEFMFQPDFLGNPEIA